MTTLLAPPAIHQEAPAAAGPDPYSLGFCASSYQNTGQSELARYSIGEGRTAFISYRHNVGFALVIQDRQGREIFASRLSNPDEIRATLSPYIV